MTQPVPLTDDIRRAVHSEDCTREGHRFQMNKLLVGSDTGRGQEMLFRNDPDEEPYVWCGRCGTLWLVLLQEAPTYAEAVARIKERVRPDTPIRPGKRGQGA